VNHVIKFVTSSVLERLSSSSTNSNAKRPYSKGAGTHLPP
jgi:hypothetical protein